MITLLTALAAPPLVTPPQERALLERLERQLVASEAVGRAAGRALQQPMNGACSSVAADAAVRATTFVGSWRDLASRAGSTVATLESLVDSPTLAPLRGRDLDQRRERIIARQRADAAALDGASRYLQRQVVPYARRCPAPLAPADGWPERTIQAADDPPRTVAVWILGAGRLCGATTSLDVQPGPALVDPADDACWTETTCTCERRPLHPGAVLGASEVR